MADSQPMMNDGYSNFPNLTFKEAAPRWLWTRNKIKQRTRDDYEQYIKALSSYFADMPLSEIRIEHIQDYQHKRMEGTIFRGRKAGPARINHECNTLSQILKLADLWEPIHKRYEAFVPPPTKGIALTIAEQDRLFALAKSNPRWKIAYYCSLITANTTAGPGEIRHLKLNDINLLRGEIRITEGAKNRARLRWIPLNPDALAAVQELHARAKGLGSISGEHYLLPHRACKKGSVADPTKPMGSWKTAWDKMRQSFGMPHLRMYDLRHTAASNLASDPKTSESTVMDIMGHTDPTMLRTTYVHVHADDRRAAINRLNRGYESEMFERSAQAMPTPAQAAASDPSLVSWSSFTFAPSLSTAEPAKEERRANLRQMPKRTNSA